MKTTIEFFIKSKDDPGATIRGHSGLAMTSLEEAKHRIAELRNSYYEDKHHNAEKTFFIVKETKTEEIVFENTGSPAHTFN